METLEVPCGCKEHTVIGTRTVGAASLHGNRERELRLGVFAVLIVVGFRAGPRLRSVPAGGWQGRGDWGGYRSRKLRDRGKTAVLVGVGDFQGNNWA